MTHVAGVLLVLHETSIHFSVLLQRGAQAMWDGAQEDKQLWGLEGLAHGICSVCGSWNYLVDAGKYECVAQKKSLS